MELNAMLLGVENNQLRFYIVYNFTIEGKSAKLYLDMSDTKYAMENFNLGFQTIGDNEPLKFNSNIALSKGADKGYIGLSVVFFSLLIAGLIAPKYIGLEAVLTLQLIFYSCLLVTDAQKYPVGFKSFL